MSPVFSKNDFVLCNVPVPKGYPQSQTHCGVILYKDKVFLSSSPFPNPKRNIKTIANSLIRKLTKGRYGGHYGEYYENPCLYIGGDSNYPPTNFKLLSPAPLMEPPAPLYGEPAFNSDPDIFVNNDEICVFFRTTLRRKASKALNRLFVAHGRYDDGIFFYNGTQLLLESEAPFISPCFKEVGNKWVVTYMDTNSYNDGKTFGGIYLKIVDRIEDIHDSVNWTRIDITGSKYIPWHMSLFTYCDVLYAIVSCVQPGIDHKCVQLLGVFSENLTKMHLCETPLCDMNSYRGSAFVDSHGDFVLYTTTVHEKVIGNRSVDGRNILLAQRDFKDILRMCVD